LRIATGLLPRSAFSDADLTALIAYVHTLDPQRVPDATDSLLHFATIIAPIRILRSDGLELYDHVSNALKRLH